MKLFTAAHRGRRLAALRRNGALEDLRVDDPALTTAQTGEIWAARVVRLLPDQGAAFLSLGDQDAYLADAGDAAVGAAILIEITLGAEGGKAARATRKLTWRGRWMAHTPSAPGVNVSRRIKEPETSARLRETLAPFASRGGFVLRRIARAAANEDLTREATRLSDAALAVLSADCASPRRLREAPAPLAQLLWEAPEAPDPVALDTHALENSGLLDEINALASPRVNLAQGWARFDRTEALIAIDVNTGGAPARAVNLPAAIEIPRQLRLRGWGGMVVMDFAGGGDQARIEAALRRAADRSLKLVGWGPLGLLEARRKRDRSPLESIWPLDE